MSYVVWIHRQLVPEPHDLLSTLLTWRRAGRTRSLVKDGEISVKKHRDLQKYRYEEMVNQRRAEIRGGAQGVTIQIGPEIRRESD